MGSTRSKTAQVVLFEGQGKDTTKRFNFAFSLLVVKSGRTSVESYAQRVRVVMVCYVSGLPDRYFRFAVGY